LPDILAFRALRSGRIVGLGATTDFHHGLLAHREQPTPERVDFWLTELRTPVLLIEAALDNEERREREADRRYWAPLREELERLRHEGR
jgi:hypothetical protein